MWGLGTGADGAGTGGVGASARGGRCSRSITVLATCAAVRMVWGGFAARGFGTRRVDFEARADFGPGADFEVGARLRTRAGLGTASFAAAPGLARVTGFIVRAGAGAAAALSFLRACLAAFFSAFNDFRACFSCAFAARTLSFAAAARSAAFAAAALSRFIVARSVGMTFKVTREIRIDGYPRPPQRKRHAPWGTRATRLYSPVPGESRGISCPASWARCRPLDHGP
jgi:hypothetical protein